MSTAFILQKRPFDFRADIRFPLLVAAAYFIGAEAAFFVGTLSDKIFAPFWPPNIVLFCALLLVPVERWWLCIAAALTAHVIVELQVGMSWSQLTVAFATNCVFAIISAIGVRHFIKGPPWFDSLRKASTYVLTAAVIGPAVGALGGAFVPIYGGGAVENYWVFWTQWYMSNALGSLTLGPIALLCLSGSRRTLERVSKAKLAEAVLLCVALVIVCAVVFEISAGKVASGFLPTLLYSPLPLILWAAVRFGARGASGAILVVTVVLIWRTLNGPNLFIAGDAETSLFAVQAFLVALAVPILLLGAAIEETHSAVRATSESEERMALAAVAANVCLWQYDRQADRMWVTEHGREMLGVGSLENLTRDFLIEMIHPDDRQGAVDMLRSATYFGKLADHEFRIVKPDGQVRWMRLQARSRNSEDADPIQISGTLTDITERRAAENEAAEQRRELAHLMRVSMLGELSGGLAHELTQPLTAILSNAQAARLLIDEKIPNLVEVAEVLDDIIDEDNRAGEVIRRLRDLLKKGEAKFEAIDLNDLVQSTLRLLHSELINRRVAVNLELATALPLASGDTVQLQQVLLNLVMNAVEAMNEMALSRRIITIQTLPTPDGDVRVNVIDHGDGLTGSQQERVFQPFFTTKPGGLGLGLSISASIMKAHGGNLRLENNANAGATASFTVPSQNGQSSALGAGG